MKNSTIAKKLACLLALVTAGILLLGLVTWLKMDKLADNVAANGHDVVQLIASTKQAVLLYVILTVAASVILGTLTGRSISAVIHRAANELSAGADQTATASGQVASASKMLAEGASEQAASLEETSASLEEISSMTKKNAENAQTTKGLANLARAGRRHRRQRHADHEPGHARHQSLQR